MPQFDICSFSSQVFWVFSYFTLFYGFITLFFLPFLLKIIKFRNKRVSVNQTNIDIFFKEKSINSIVYRWFQVNTLFSHKFFIKNKNNYSFIKKLFLI